MPTFPSIGQEIGGYRVDDLIGRGGMSVVYLAEQLALGRKVALKLLSPELSEDEEFRKRFVRESRLAANLEHPNIIPVYEAGEVDGLLFIAMRYVQGSDLKAMLNREGPLPLDRLIEVISQAAYALDAAHSRGLVHRDVKPGNILVASGEGPEDSEHVYLSDFGLTKRTDSKSRLTSTGQFVGTLHYVAPEQIQGKDVSGRTDLYALACVAYECLAGSPPFERDSEVAVMYAHLQEPPPNINEVRDDLAPPVGEALARALAKAPEERYENCRSFMRALRDVGAEPVTSPSVATGPTSQPDTPGVTPLGTAVPATTGTSASAVTGPMERGSATTAPHRPRTGVPMWIVVGAIAAVGLAGSAFLLTRGGDDPRDRSTPTNPSPEPSDTGGGAGTAAFPAGTVAYSRVTGGNYEVWTGRLDGIELTGEARLCSFEERHIGPPEWSPDRSKIVIAIEDETAPDREIYVINLEADNPCAEIQQLTDNDAHDGVPTWSPPNGQMIAWSSDVGPGGSQDIWVMSADGTGERNLTPDSSADDYPDWSPDGSEIAFHSQRDGDKDIYTISVDGDDEPIQVTTNDLKDIQPDWAPDDRILFTRQPAGSANKDIWMIDPDGDGEEQLTSSEEVEDHGTWVPQKDQVIFDSLGDLWLFDLSTGEIEQLTDSPERESDPMTG